MSKKRKPNSGNPAKSDEKPDESSVWVRTEPTLDGKGWMVTIEFGPDKALARTEVDVREYVDGVLDAVTRAEYDAAVYHQLSAKVDSDGAAHLIKDLRDDRPPQRSTAPLELAPGVSEKGKPFIVMSWEGKPFAQWDPKQAREHALQVMETVVVADLDAGYLRALKGVIGLEDEIARAVIGDLRSWR